MEIVAGCAGIAGAIPPVMYSKASLYGYIDDSRRRRRSLSHGLLVATGLVLLLSLSHPGVAVRALGLIGVVAACGLWILTAHINDWEGQLRRRNNESQ